MMYECWYGLNTDKGVSIVVMDREEYIQKSEELLS